MKTFLIFCLILCIFFAGCESDGLKTAYITDATQSLSTSYAVKVVLGEDDRISEKFADVQVKCDIAGQIVAFGAESDEKVNIVFDKADEWYNLTILLARANGNTGYESYEKYEDFGNKTYLITSLSDCNLTFRVVIGDATKNDAGTGEILTGAESISSEFELEVKKYEE